MKIGLIGYPAEYFLEFAKRLEKTGFEVFWICALTSDATFLKENGVIDRNILDVNVGFSETNRDIESSREILSRIESDAGPNINDIIMMDRILSKKSWRFSYLYLGHLTEVVTVFLLRSEVRLVSSWRDTALQIISMLICKAHGIPWVVPTRARIPQEMYGFCTTHDTAGFVPFRAVTHEDSVWAEKFLNKYETEGVRPALKISTRSFEDVVKMIPVHLKVFLYEFRRSAYDKGNDYARYPIYKLIFKYIFRRLNLLAYNLLPPYEKVGESPFCIYALHTQPESSIDVVGSYFSDQINLIKFIARSLPVSYELYVKVHPTDVDGKNLSFYREIKAIPGVRLINFNVDSRYLMNRCKIVFALTGTIAYEAALLGKPVIVFAKNYFNSLPTISYCDAPPKLSILVNSVIKDESSERKRDLRNLTLAFLSQLKASCVFGEVSRVHQINNPALKEEDYRVLADVYVELFEYFNK